MFLPAIDYTPPVNHPQVIQVDYCDSTRLDTTWHPGWVPVYGSPWFCPTIDAEPMFTNPPPVQIADAIVAYPGPNGTIVTISLGGSQRRFLV